MFRFSFLFSALLACLCLSQNPLWADLEDHVRRMGGPNKATPEELRMLPVACIAKERKDHDESKMWERTLGEAFTHLHHYCNGLTFLNRIERGIGDRKYLQNAALDEFQYMQRIPADSPLRPELDYNMGQVLYELNRIPEAIAPLRRVIRLKPDYVRAYLLLSLCYKRMEDTAGAAEVLRTGLAKVPDSRALQSALDELNTTKPDSGKGK